MLASFATLGNVIGALLTGMEMWATTEKAMLASFATLGNVIGAFLTGTEKWVIK
jgi:hypothetical protein